MISKSRYDNHFNSIYGLHSICRGHLPSTRCQLKAKRSVSNFLPELVLQQITAINVIFFCKHYFYGAIKIHIQFPVHNLT